MTDRKRHEISAVEPEKIPSGVAGLDIITTGGFFRGGVYMFLARPGSGKTILANQIGFGHVASGGCTVYITLLAESHARLISSLRPFAFFDESVIGTSLTYLSGYDALEKGKLEGLLELVRKTVRAKKTTLLVIDGLMIAGDVAESTLEIKKFIHALQAFVELAGCTTLVLAGARPEEQYELRTMVDGLLQLSVDPVGMSAVRTIELPKFRGSAVMIGKHFFEISNHGVTVYPRTELRWGLGRPEPDPSLSALATFGIPALDRMLDGGLRASSTTALLGAPGSGKTLLGLNFLTAGARHEEPGLYFGFFEPPGVLARRADAVGLELTSHVESGLVSMVSRSPRTTVADALADELLTAVRARGVRRLFVDGLDSFEDSLVYPERTRLFFGALCDELRSLGVATVFSAQTESLAGIELPAHGLTEILDTVVALRHVEEGTNLRKRISVVKMREGEGDSSVHELVIGRKGIVVSPLGRAPKARKKPGG